MTARPDLPPPPVPAPAAADLDLTAYQTGRPCWVWRSAAWHPGVILYATTRAATVRYQLDPAAPGTAVDTVTADQLHPRTGHPDLPTDPTPEKGDQL